MYISSTAIRNTDKKYILSLKEIIIWLAAVVVILNSGYYRTVDSYFSLIMLIATTVLVAAMFDKRGKIDKSARICMSLFAIAAAFSVIANLSVNNILSGARVFVTAFCSYVLFTRLNFELFIKHFSRLIRFIIYMSILLFIWNMVIGRLPNIKFGNYYDFIIVTTVGVDGRATGCFWEPGVFASIIILTMMLENFFSKEPLTSYKLILYSLGVILSKSTAGILILIIFLVSYFWERSDLNKNKAANLFFVIFALLFTVYYEDIFRMLYNLSPDIFSKLIETSSGTTATRLNAPVANLKIFADSPVFGHGFTDAATLFTEYMGGKGTEKIVAQTSTSTQLLAAMGIGGLVYTAMMLVPLLRRKNKDIGFVSKVSIALILVFVANKEPHVFIVLTWIMLFLLTESNFENQKTGAQLNINE